MKLILISIILAAFLEAGSINPSIAQTPEQLYQKGLIKEEGEGALQDAINFYNKIADNSNADKSLQAKALLHIGICYEKLGMKEAIKAYQRLVNNFPAQKNEVMIARERLSRLTTIESPKEIAIKQFWTGPNVDNSGSVSADGEYLTFNDWSSGNLMIRNLKTNEIKQLTVEGTWKDPNQYVFYSLISPDGKQVAYSLYKYNGSCDLKLIKLGNQTPVILCSEMEDIIPSLWFSNGNKIIVQKYDISEKIWDLSSINIINGEIKSLIKKELAPGPGPSFFPVFLSLSFEEKYIAFDFPDPAENGKYDIFILSLDSNNELPLIEHPANDRLLGWLPGRSELLFTSDRSGTTDVWAVNTSGNKPFDDPKCILTNIGDIHPLGSTRNGALYFSMLSFLYESFLVPFNNDSGKLSIIARTSLPGLITDVCWLPDGESLICLQHILEPDKTWSNILNFLNSRTGEARALASNLNIEGQFRLSPNGRSVLVLGRDKRRAGDKDAKKGIYSVDLTTGLPVEIKVKNDLTLSWSAEWDKEGKNIFYTINNQILKLNIDSGEEMILYNGKRLNVPILTRSSDGKSLLFDDLENIDDEGLSLCHLLKIPEFGGGAKIMYTYNSEQNWRFKRFALSPEGKYVYFTALDSALKSILYRIPAAGGTPEIIWQQPKDFFFAGISIHPEGKKIALSVSKPGIEIRVIENLDRKVSEIYSKNE
jgi:Tol biopolymer transport system component